MPGGDINPVPALTRKYTEDEEEMLALADEAFCDENRKCVICGCNWDGQIHSAVIGYVNEDFPYAIASIHCDACVPGEMRTCWQRGDIE